MSREQPFFKGSDTSFGIFYPTDYLIAVFATADIAEQAASNLHAAGYADDDVRAMDGASVKADIEARVNDATWLDQLQQTFSIGKEAWFWNEDLKSAEQGAGFLAVHCTTEDEAQRIVTMLRPLQPISMRRYRALAIETFT